MILWCCYCQRLLGEVEPLSSFAVTHGCCPSCNVRLEEDGDALIEEHAVLLRLQRALREAALEGDRRTCASLARAATDAGLGVAEILLGLVQPALVDIGERWAAGQVSVADEHRFTAWCEEMLATVALPPVPPGPLELAIFQVPGNHHDVGPRIAERLLLARGIRAELIRPELPSSELVTYARAMRPAWIGFSCALPQMVATALREASTLRAGGFEGGLVISGQAVRAGSSDSSSWGGAEELGVWICRTLDEAIALVRGAEGARPAGGDVSTR